MNLMIRDWTRTTFSALGDGHYGTLWVGTTLSFLAFAMSSVVQGVVAYDITHKNGSVGNVALGMGLATILTAPFGGVIADRVSKRMLLLIGQVLIAVNFTAAGFLITTGHITISLLVVSTFMMGLVFSFIAPARQAWIGELLKGPRLANGIALQQVAMTSTRIFPGHTPGLPDRRTRPELEGHRMAPWRAGFAGLVATIGVAGLADSRYAWRWWCSGWPHHFRRRSSSCSL